MNVSSYQAPAVWDNNIMVKFKLGKNYWNLSLTEKNT